MKDKKLSLVSYTFATLAGVCFVGGKLKGRLMWRNSKGSYLC